MQRLSLNFHRLSANTIAGVICTILTLLPLQASADLEAELEREIERFKSDIQSLNDQDLIDAADRLAGTGITDPMLYEVVETRTKQEYASHLAERRNKQVARNLNALIRAYASFGNPASRSFLLRLVDESKSRGVRNRAHRLHPKLGWFALRNQQMQAGAEYYESGQDLMTHRYLSLLTSADPTVRRWAAEEIFRRGGSEAPVYESMAASIEQEATSYTTDFQLDVLAWYLKILATFDSANHKELLDEILNGPEFDKKLKKYARY